MSLRGRVVWVTGASSGIGEALALALVAEGARVIVSARRRDRLDALRARAARPDDVHVLPLDVADTAAAPVAVNDAIAAFGGVDVMIHNAGISQRSLAADTGLDVDRRVMEVNYFGPVALTKALLPHMLARRSGRFVVVSSVVGYVGTPERSAYAASKHALHGFFDSLRAEVFASGLRVTLVCPGFVATDITLSALRGDGSPLGVRAEKNAGGLSPEACARAIVRAIERDREEVYVGGREIAGIYLRRFAPAVLSRLVRSVKTT